MSDSRSACAACGALNGEGAQFCGQCFAPLRASPAASMHRSRGAVRGAPQPAWTPPASPETRTGGMPVVTDGNGWVLRLILVAVMVSTGWAGFWYVRHRPHTVEAQDGTFSVTYSSYWGEMDMEGLPPIPGFSPDLAIENDSSGVFIMHMPAPPGAEDSLARALTRPQLEQAIAMSPWPGKLDESMSPGTTTLAGKNVVVEAKASIDFEGTSGKLDLLVGVSPDESIVLMIAHGCMVDECSASEAEFSELLKSIEFAETSQGAL
jgi:hypothetical protein